MHLFPIHILLISLLVAVLYMTFWFIVSLILKRNDVADFAWGIGFFLVSLVPYILAGPSIQGVLIFIWGVRLSTHVLARNRHKAEDPRYTEWREKWGRYQMLGSFLQVFLLQSILLFLIVSPALIIISMKGNSLGTGDVISVIVWIIGFYFESTADAQLKHFIADPENKGKIMDRGLWQYSRHPNYFGEVTMWWGIWIMALAVPYGIIGIIGPIVITVLITQVSGIPLVEKSFIGKPGFDAYKASTSIFFPLPPKKKTLSHF
jgi:steroid 5-alpha reductase family enzyme